MHHIEHQLDKYIAIAREQLNALPENSLPVDTTNLQLMCLEKFANIVGYEVRDGLFVCNNPATPVITLTNIVAMYNRTLRNIPIDLPKLNGLMLERVYLSGRSLRKGFKVMKHQVQFIAPGRGAAMPPEHPPVEE
jgi:hypothetical protein